MNKPRLIDANKYKNDLLSLASHYNLLGNHELARLNRELAKNVDNIPTAYDIDKVVEQLKDSKFWTEPTYDEDGYCNDDSWEIIDLDDAIEIVRKGGGKHDD